MSDQPYYSVDLRDLQAAIHENAKAHGFWEASDNIGEKLALIHSEVSEALEDYRHGNMKARRVALNPYTEATGEAGEPVGFPIEIADVVIRCLDLAEYLGFDLGEAIAVKARYNDSRPYLHGKRL